MKLLSILFVSVFCFAFSPSTENAVASSSNGFYVFVKDLTNRTYHRYIVESKDSVDILFKNCFESELELGDIDRPITIYNGEHDFYVSRVYVFKKPNGKKCFKQLKYPNPYKKVSRRLKLSPVTL